MVLQSMTMRSQRRIIALVKACLLLSPRGFGSADLLSSSVLRVGIQKCEGSVVFSSTTTNTKATLNRHHHGRCDGSIFGELLKEELWSWAHAEIQSFLHEFELGDLEVDDAVSEEEQSLEHLLLLGNGTTLSGRDEERRRQFVRNNPSDLPEMEDATLLSQQNLQQRQPQRYCDPRDSSDGLCHMFRAPLSIPITAAAPVKQRTREESLSLLAWPRRFGIPFTHRSPVGWSPIPC
jgi:hypothetical protein